MTSGFASTLDLHRPGIWIVGPDKGWVSETGLILGLIEDEFERAVTAWSAFDPISVSRTTPMEFPKHIRCLRQIFAREFVLSLDLIQKLLLKLPDPPDGVAQCTADYRSSFGSLKHIRDSFAHVEDRGRGKGKGEIDLGTRVLLLSCFLDDRFMFTGSDGEQYGIDVTYSTLSKAHVILQAVLNSYSWG